VLILDEPTAALGVRQAAAVLEYVTRARERGVGVVVITHNPHHAMVVGDRFVVLRQGEVVTDRGRGEIHVEELGGLMASTTIAMP
jgi:simple sugar transport system ATP-binding protein